MLGYFMDAVWNAAREAERPNEARSTLRGRTRALGAKSPTEGGQTLADTAFADAHRRQAPTNQSRSQGFNIGRAQASSVGARAEGEGPPR
eukprot:5068615-Pyramimonas_sp.AAC.1